MLSAGTVVVAIKSVGVRTKPSFQAPAYLFARGLITFTSFHLPLSHDPPRGWGQGTSALMSNRGNVTEMKVQPT